MIKSAFVFLDSFNVNGDSVPNGSMFKGTDGELYYKNDAGVVRQLN